MATRLDIEVCGDAANGEEAIAKAHSLKPDLIILDITMPILNGLDAARVIRLTLPDLPILLLTMHEGKHIIEDAQKIGIEGFVCKSEASARLLAAVDAVLRNQPSFPNVWILTNGVVRRGMPVWSKLPEPQRWQLVSFLKSLRNPSSLPVEESAP